MFTVKPDGSIQCDTAKEALELQAAILSGTAPQIAAAPRIPLRNAAKDEDLDFLRKLTPHVGKELDAKAIAPLIGAEGPAGAGSKLNWTGKRLDKAGYRIKDYLRYRKDDEGIRWTVLKGL
jgi:hypothetical protein